MEHLTYLSDTLLYSAQFSYYLVPIVTNPFGNTLRLFSLFLFLLFKLICWYSSDIYQISLYIPTHILSTWYLHDISHFYIQLFISNSFSRESLLSLWLLEVFYRLIGFGLNKSVVGGKLNKTELLIMFSKGLFVYYTRKYHMRVIIIFEFL